MKLFIDKDSKVEDVKKIFTNRFPFLKIELYKKPFADGNTAIKKDPLASGASLKKFIHEADKTSIDINADITVAELEDQFAGIGLIAEVFRKSGNVWVETSLTNNWSLLQQNTEGEEISSHFTAKIIHPDSSHQ
ncbi:MAG: hypothetical protein ABI405_01320 [Parafilimonas sp.]